jgi:two-component system, LytTR family, sensor kinase
MADDKHAALTMVFGPRRRVWPVITAVVILLSLVDALQTYVGLALQGRPISLLRALAVGFCLWLPLGGLVWPTLWLAAHVRLNAQNRWRALVIHVIGGATFASLLLLSASILRISVGLRPLAEFVGDLSTRMAWLFGVDFLIYWVVVGSYYAFYYYQLAIERELAASHLRATLTESRLQALRAQLNPHFLFNTLNAISVMAMQGDHRAVVNTIGRLGELLRVSLDDRLPQRLPLAAELEFLGGYLDIQRVRFADRLTIEQEVPPDTLQALVPSLILQPLVENAISHGVATRQGAGRIAISAAREETSLRLSVSDTGTGFVWPAESSRSRGIGLTNTRERLVQLYGSASRMECGVGPHGGGLVVISIPFELAADGPGP